MKRFYRFVWICIGITVFAVGIAAGLLILLVNTDLVTSFNADKLENYAQTTWILDRNDEVIGGVYATENRVYTDLAHIPQHVRNAFIAAEDVRFYQHHGIDPVRILGALAANLRSGSLTQGASTITQQLIKNTHLTAEKTWARKIEEIILALKVEKAYTKDQILEMYLNYVYFGNGAYGIQMASYLYFDKYVEELTLTEAAALAAVLKAPSNYAPHIQPENNQTRRNQVLDVMLEENMITEKQALEAQNEELQLKNHTNSVRLQGWYPDAVLSEAEQRLGIGGKMLMEMGLRIYTGMDKRIQEICDTIYEKDVLFPDNSADGTLCQSALVLMDSSTGEVLAMEGGRNYSVRRGFNRALQGRRQPGSVLKPLAVYAPALERRIVTPASVMMDQKKDFDGYCPQNYGDIYYGAVTLRTAVAKSLNVAPVQLLYEMGGRTGYESLLRFHVEPDVGDTGLSLAVGSMKYGVTPLRLCAAYASLSAGGIYREPVLIRRIEDRDGNVLFEAASETEDVLEPNVCYVLNHLLQSVTSWGTGKVLGDVGTAIAGKTGTVGYDDEQNRDAWSVAYTPHLAAVCWMGFDETDAQHALSAAVTGGSYPSRLLKELFQQLNLPNEEFIPPDQGVVWACLDAQTMQEEGEPLLAGKYTAKEDSVYEVFIAGTEPTVNSDIRVIPKAPQDLSVYAGKSGYPIIEFTVLDEWVIYHLYRNEHGNVHEIAQMTGIAGSASAYHDISAQRLHTYEYFVVAEFEQTGMFAEPTPSVRFTVPLRGLWLPWE